MKQNSKIISPGLIASKIKVLWTLFTFLHFNSAHGAVEKLSEAIVQSKILTQSIEARDIQSRHLNYDLILAQAKGAFDWTSTSELGWERDRLQSLQTLTEFSYERSRFNSVLSKRFTYGLLSTIEYNWTGQKANLNDFSTPPYPPSTLTQNTLGVSLELPLWQNQFGNYDKAQLEAVSKKVEGSRTLQANEYQDLVVNGAMIFWAAYAAQESYLEAQAVRDRYKKLVESVQKKTKFSYNSPGELSQVQAEYEGREQIVRSTNLDYQTQLERLKLLLGLSADTAVTFDVDKKVQEPKLKLEKSYKNSRAFRAQELKVQASNEALTASQSKDHPNLALIAKAYTSGLEDTTDPSLHEMTSFSHPKYYVGLKLTHTFGSDNLSVDRLNKIQAKLTEESRMKRLETELLLDEKNSQNKVEMTYQLLLSTQSQEQFREKAVKELTQSYNQGRTDISFLIDALNKYYATKIQFIKTLGDYHMALLDWRAKTDNLLPDDFR